MYKLFIFLLLSVTCSSQRIPQPFNAIDMSFYCGGEDRWDIKTLMDPEAANINYNYADTTILALTHLPLFQARKHSPRQPAEMRVYGITAKLLDYFQEADGDLHLVLQDPDHPKATMIAEIPNAECDRVEESPYAPEFAMAREMLLSKKKKEVLGQVIYITGPAFYDLKHSKPQRGVAPNEIEIHPVISLEYARNTKHN